MSADPELDRRPSEGGGSDGDGGGGGGGGGGSENVRFRAKLRFSGTEPLSPDLGMVASLTRSTGVVVEVDRHDGASKSDVFGDLKQIVDDVTADSDYETVDIDVLREGEGPYEGRYDPVFITPDEVREETYRWNDVDVGEVRGVDFIEGVEGRVLIDASGVYSGESVSLVFEEYIRQNGLDDAQLRSEDHERTELQHACESLLWAGVRSIERSNDVDVAAIRRELAAGSDMDPVQITDSAVVGHPEYDVRDDELSFVGGNEDGGTR
jgi:hypothetical protein